MRLAVIVLENEKIVKGTSVSCGKIIFVKIEENSSK